MDLSEVRIGPLSEQINISTFRCGTPEIDRWVKTKAKKHHELNRTKIFCALRDGSSSPCGFYCLSFSSEDANKISGQYHDIYKHSGVPLVYITYLAVVSALQNGGLGKFMLVDALRRAHLVSEHVAFYGVALRSLNARTTELYEKFGFGKADDEPFPLMILPVWTLFDLFGKS